ncbi:hypothetical protein DB30_00511 [Enhygromyxa salina]|uniref:Uncharacterized protein n=1 Tax=Enhygromyxa salina TaxID=215803 RepID=A0A0C1ZQ67_9BACT|nr:hypothetical protein DB30_00511 [Enhygromyxa salina]
MGTCSPPAISGRGVGESTGGLANAELAVPHTSGSASPKHRVAR